MATRAGVSLVACALVASGGLGCSWIGVTPPPTAATRPGEPVECTTDRTAPGADLVGAVVFGGLAAASAILAAWAAATPDPCLRGCDGGEVAPTFYALVSGGIALGAAVLATLYGVSARGGYAATRRCRELKALAEPDGQAALPGRAPPEGAGCGAIFDRTSCGPGLRCVEHRCVRLAPDDVR